MSARRWTESEDTELRERFPACTAGKLAEVLGRTEVSIWGRAKFLGVQKARVVFSGVVPPEVDLAYTAGIVDGEGSIQINPNRRGKARYWGLTVSICVVAGEFLRDLRRVWGDVGSFSSYRPRIGRREAFVWRFYGAQAEWFIRSLLPYLRLKKEHAEAALRFRAQIVPIGGRLSLLNQEGRTASALEMRVLNERTGKARARLTSVGR